MNMLKKSFVLTKEQGGMKMGMKHVVLDAEQIFVLLLRGLGPWTTPQPRHNRAPLHQVQWKARVKACCALLPNFPCLSSIWLHPFATRSVILSLVREGMDGYSLCCSH